MSASNTLENGILSLLLTATTFADIAEVETVYPESS